MHVSCYYTTVLPDNGACPATLPITDAELQRARGMAAQLAADTAAAAHRNGAVFVQASKATHGDEICSADPWVFGFTFSGHPLQYGRSLAIPHRRLCRLSPTKSSGAQCRALAMRPSATPITCNLQKGSKCRHLQPIPRK